MWRKIRRNYRRMAAFLLTLAIVGTNVCGNVGIAFAAGNEESALFLVDGEELREAIREAAEHKEVFAFSSLELAAARKSIKNKYEKLLGKKAGAVYELDLEIDDSYAPEGTAVQVFYHADTKDVIFLFFNESDMEVEYRVNIDGYETEPVTVKPNTMNIEDEDEQVFGENYEAADMIDDVKDTPKAEVVKPQESMTEDEIEENGEDADDESSAADESVGEAGDSQETENIKDTDVETEADLEIASKPETEARTEAEGEREIESEEETKSEQEAERETEAGQEAERETEAEPETEAEAQVEPENEEEPDDSGYAAGEILSMSHYQVPMVAISLEDGEEESLEEETEAAVEETEPQTEETIAEEPEEETENAKESETNAEDVKESETKADKADVTDKESIAADKESTTVDKETTDAATDKETTDKETTDTDEKTAGQENAAAEETIADTKEEKEDGSESPVEESVKAEESGADIPKETTKSQDKDIEESNDSAEPEKGAADSDGGKINSADKMEGQLLEDDSIAFLGKLKGKDFETVTLKNHVNAKAVKVAWEDIEQIIAADEEKTDELADYLVDYTVNIPEGASVEGALVVAAGEDLYFAVEPEENYELIAVYANGEELEKIEDVSEQASASDWAGSSYVYVVKDIEEDLLVEVEVEESDIAVPAAVYTAEAEDAVFTVDVPGDAFEEEVQFRAEKIHDESKLEELTSQADEALGEGHAVAAILAYDLAFFNASDEEVEPSKPVNVSISFKETAVSPEIAEDATGISVVHFPEGEEAKAVTAVQDTDVEELVFEAESFSTWAAVAMRNVEINYDGWSKVESLKDLHKVFWPDPGTGKKAYLNCDIVTDYKKDIPYENGDYGWAIPEGTDFVLDLKGHTLTYGGEGSGNKRLFYVRGTLTIMDSVGTGVIDCNQDIEAPIYVDNGGTLNLEGGTIRPGEGRASDHGVYVNGWTSVFNMNGGSIENCGTSSTDGGGVYLEKGIVNVNGGSIKGNTAKNGGGIYAARGNVKVYGGSIEQNTAADGGGIYVAGGFHAVNGGEIKGNTVSNNGGGIYVCPGVSMDIANEAKINGNESTKKEPLVTEDEAGYNAGSGGGGIYSLGNLKVLGGEISGNKALADGGGIYVDFKSWNQQGKASFMMTDGLISNNVAQNGEGGGIYFGGDGTITGGSIVDNHTYTSFDWGGGGVFIQTGVSLKMTNALITDNIADGFGGGVAGCPSGHVKIFTVNGAAIYDNTAKGEGMTHRTEEDRKTQDKEAQADPLFMKDGRYQDYYCQNESVVYGKMLGGGSANWVGSSKQKGGQTEEITIGRYESKSASYRMGLSADPDESGKAYAESRATVRIAGNTSTTHGAGIMCNGFLELGEKGPGYFEVSKTVLGSKEAREKEWGFTLFLSDSEGKPLAAGQVGSDSPDGEMGQDCIAFALKNEKGELEYGSLALAQDEEKGTKFYQFALKDGQSIIFDDLPAGTVYHVVEDEANEGGFTTLVSGSADTIAIEDERDATKVIGAEGIIRAAGSDSQNQGMSALQEKSSVDFLNMQLSELSVSKTVVGKTEEQSWLFTLTLLDPDGKPLQKLPGTYDTIDGAMQVNTVAFELSTGDVTEIGSLPVDEENGQVKFMLGNNQKILFKDIPAGTLYRIVEDGADDSVFEVKVNGPEDSKNITAETDPEKVVGVEGTVAATPTATQFINARLGSLAVSKTVVGDEQAEDQEWEFNLKIHRDPENSSHIEENNEWDLDSEMQVEVLPYEISSNGTVIDAGSLALDDEEGKTAFVLKHGQTITIKDIPVGSTYEVSEVKANDGFITSVIGNVEADNISDEDHDGKIKGIKGIILGDQITNASFINTKSDILTVSKTVKGNDQFGDYEWMFTLKLFDKDGRPLWTSEDGSWGSQGVDGRMQAPVVAYKGGSMLAGVEAPQDGSIALENGEAKFGLKHGQFISFIDLPVGTAYTVTEDEANASITGDDGTNVNFFADVTGSEGSEIVPDGKNASWEAGVSGTIASGKPAKADFINQSGNLTVRKILRGNQADATKAFPFTVTLDDQSINGRYGEMEFVDGVAEFTLKGGEAIKADGLPVNVGYVVEEHDNTDYEVESSHASGKVTANGVIVTFINTKNENPPDEPEKPDKPDNPPGRPNRPSGGGGGNPPRGGDNPGGPGTTTNINEPDVPLANFPPEPITEVFEETDVPLAALPKTGDSRQSGAMMALLGIAGLGALFSAIAIHKKKEE